MTDLTVTVREPADVRLRLRHLRGYGPILRALATRDLKARYKQSFLGPAWLVFQPLALLGAFAVGFQSVASIDTGGVPYVLFALVGLTVWTYFQATLMVAVGSIVNNYALVRWTACPRLALPLATLISSSPSFAICAVATVIAAGVSGHLSIGVLLLPLLTLWLALLTAALAVLVAGLSVRARDVMSVMPFFLQVLLFVSPVAYGTSQLPSSLQGVLAANPLTGLIDAWRWALLGVDPDGTAVCVSLGVTVALVVLGWKVFAAIEAVLADEI
jgi:lipopolysaccharide transport system permease protein